MEIKHLAEAVVIDGKEFNPMVELLKSQLQRIYGENFESGFEVKEILTDNEGRKFGVVATYFGDRIGFSFNNEDHWREFRLSCGEHPMMLNQLEMFDQIRAWGFLIL